MRRRARSTSTPCARRADPPRLLSRRHREIQQGQQERGILVFLEQNQKQKKNQRPVLLLKQKAEKIGLRGKRSVRAVRGPEPAFSLVSAVPLRLCRDCLPGFRGPAARRTARRLPRGLPAAAPPFVPATAFRARGARPPAVSAACRFPAPLRFPPFRAAEPFRRHAAFASPPPAFCRDGLTAQFPARFPAPVRRVFLWGLP